MKAASEGPDGGIPVYTEDACGLPAIFWRILHSIFRCQCRALPSPDTFVKVVAWYDKRVGLFLQMPRPDSATIATPTGGLQA